MGIPSPLTQHTLEADERDDPLLPRSGFRVKMAQEVAGVGGDVCFGKAELQSEAYWELFSDWVRRQTDRKQFQTLERG